ncbi:hypothetical protein HOY80DRAFT_1088995 [Tuber brumale]|nr:hypothetical protein HOY80DRAFT_1088995 [Tuber brumale]
MAFLLQPILAAALPHIPFTALPHILFAHATNTRKIQPTETLADKAIPPPPVTSTVTYSRRSTTVTITIHTDITISQSEEEQPTKPTSVKLESSTSSSLLLKPSSDINVLDTSIAQDSSTISTTTASEPSVTGAHVTTFGLGDKGQLVHSGPLTGTAISTDGSTFKSSATSTSKTTHSEPSHPFSKTAIIGIAAGTFVALASLIAVIFCYSYKRRGFKKMKKNEDTSINLGDEEAKFRRHMGQSSQVREIKASHPFTPIYERAATVPVYGLQNAAPWNKPNESDITSHSSSNTVAPPTPSTSNAISPYGNYTPTISDYTIGKNSSRTSDSDLYAPPSTLRLKYQQTEASRQAGKLLTSVSSSSQNQTQLLTPPYNTGKSPPTHELQPIVTEIPTAQTTKFRESIWDDNISIVEPHLDMRRDAYPSISRMREEENIGGPSIGQFEGRRPSSILSDLQQSNTWRDTAPNKLSMASSHPSLHIPESGTWRQNDRKNSVQRTGMGGVGNTLGRQDSDPRNELHLKREEIKGLRVSTLLANNRWEKARKLFSGEGS